MRMTMQAYDGVVPEWTLADRLRKARLMTGLEAQEFADEIGIHRNSVRNYERGRLPRPIVLKAWALRSGVSYEWLVTGECRTNRAKYDTPATVHVLPVRRPR